MPCLDCGRPGPRLCTACSNGRSRARGTTTQRGYGATHQAERERWRPAVEAGEVDCGRCGKRLKATDEWDLGHSDDRTKYLGPEHSRECNRAAAGRARHGR
jgi:hypothetical protein